MIDINSAYEISIQRGDYAEFYIHFTKNSPEDGTQILFTVKKNYEQQTPYIEKTLVVEQEKALVQLFNSDTKSLPFGDYLWDIRLPNLYGEKEPYTPISPKRFTVARVVGNV